ncbi:MAG: hypothetical protein ORN57_01510, partial [Alphaproteobacteria bacterium]|nr:hypothetical protein [Alphaproteobacteria bacterium]
MVLDYPRWKKILVMLVMALGFVYLLPNLVPAWQNKSAKEFFALGSTISLGLDLQGGAHLLLEIDNQEFKKEKIARLEDRVRELLRKNSYGYFNLGHDDMAVHLTARGDEAAAVANLLRKELNDVVPSSNGLASGGNLIDIKQLGNGFTIGYSEKGLTQLLNQLQEQAANIIRRRVDALGNREALVSPQGNNRLIVQVPGEQNPETLKNAIGKTAKLTFHLLPKPGEASITVRNEAGANIQVAQVPVVGGDELQDAGSSFSEGKPVVSFRFSSSGGLAFGRAT